MYVLSEVSDYFYGQEISETYAKANIVANICSDLSETGRIDGLLLKAKLEETGIETGLFTNASKIIVTDKGGSVIYDNSHTIGGAEMHITTIFPSVIDGKNNNIVSESDDGFHKLEVGVPVKNDKGQIKGAVFIIRSLSQTDGYMSDLQRMLIWVIIVIALIYAVVSALIAGLVTTPLARLTKAVEAIEHGGKNQQVEVSGHDEIARLSQSFNDMSKQIDLLEEKRSQFISDASHELKTPLATIKLSCESAIVALSSPEADVEAAKEFLGDVNGEIDRLNRIIEKLLSLTKSNSQSASPELDTVDLKTLCKTVVKKLLPLAHEKNISLTFVENGENEYHKMLLDFDKIYEAVYNITDNSIKYTNNDGSVTISLSSDISRAVIEIEDTGIGIPKGEEGLVFDRFYRVDRARSRKTGGTGLGLAIAKDAIEAHGGHIELLSEEGVGSRFIIILPYTGK